MATTVLCRHLSMVSYRKWQDGANNGLVGAASRGMNTVGWLQMSRHAMLSKQCVLYTHTAPYLGVRVKQAVSLVG